MIILKKVGFILMCLFFKLEKMIIFVKTLIGKKLTFDGILKWMVMDIVDLIIPSSCTSDKNLCFRMYATIT